jgi:hypothetical protein
MPDDDLTPNDKYRIWASLLRGIMLTATTQAGGRYVPWNQYLIGKNEKYNEWLGRGMCRGLSVKFLELERDGRNFIDEVNGASLEVLDRYIRPALNTEIRDASLPGNLGDGAKALHDFMSSEYHFKHVGTETFGNHSGFQSHERLGKFVGHSPYYYLVSFPGHAMACAANKGRKVFFEPNSGIGHFQHTAQLVKFSSLYFGHPEIKRLYGHGSKVVLKAHRYLG